MAASPTPRSPIPLRPTLWWSGLSLGGGILGALNLWVGARIASEPQVEGMAAVSAWMVGMMFAVAGIVGAALTLGYSSRVTAARHSRAIARTAAGGALGASIAAVLIGVVAPFL